MWSGSEASIPTGWVLCNGQNSTPDLRNKFIVGAGTGSNYGVAQVGGADSVTLTSNQMPSHNHTVQGAGDHNHPNSTASSTNISLSGDTGSSNAPHSHTGTTDGAGAHSHSLNRDSGNSNVNSQSDRYALATNNNVGRDGTSGVGNHSHNLTINSGNAPHSHTVSVSGSHTHTLTLSSSGTHTHIVDSTGGGNAHENRPPFYALCFIMKT